MDSKPLENTSPVDIPIVFILAKGRSGTTLLQTMLDAHPNIIAPLESRFVVHFRNRYGAVKKWTPVVKDQYINDVLGDTNISLFWEMNVELLTKRIYQLPENTTYGMICKQVYTASKSFFPKEKPKLIVDKNPIHAVLTPLLLSVFPDARFVHLVRDFRANANSLLKFEPSQSMRGLGFMWIYYNSKIEALKRQKQEKFHTLIYEDLVQFPTETLTKLTNFFNLPFLEVMLLYYKTIQDSFGAYVERSPSETIKKIRASGAKNVHNNLTRPLEPDLMNSWRSKLSEKQVAELEAICGLYARRYGYTAKNQKEVVQKVPFAIRLQADKLLWYYSMPIWLRELKSKPSLALLPKE